jgi:hypothetical protein
MIVVFLLPHVLIAGTMILVVKLRRLKPHAQAA